MAMVAGAQRIQALFALCAANCIRIFHDSIFHGIGLAGNKKGTNRCKKIIKRAETISWLFVFGFRHLLSLVVTAYAAALYSTDV